MQNPLIRQVTLEEDDNHPSAAEDDEDYDNDTGYCDELTQEVWSQIHTQNDFCLDSEDEECSIAGEDCCSSRNHNNDVSKEIIELSQQTQDLDINDDSSFLEEPKNKKYAATLTQIGFFSDQKTGSNRKKPMVSPSTSEKKKQKVLHQITLTQIDRRDNVPKQLFSDPFYKSTAERVYYKIKFPIDGIPKDTWRIFNKGETFPIIHSSKNYDGCTCIIQSFQGQIAVAKVYQKLNNTFIEGIRDDGVFQEFFEDAKVNDNQLVLHEDMKRIHVKYLGGKNDQFSPPPCGIIKYRTEMGEKECFGTKGHGFLVSYCHSKQHNMKLEDYGELPLDPEDLSRIDNVESNYFYGELDVDPEDLNRIDNVENNYFCQKNEKSSSNNNGEPAGKMSTILSLDTSGIKTNQMIQDSSINFNPVERSNYDCDEQNGSPSVLDIFAGIGGASQGFIKAGFDVKWAVEKDHFTAKTFQLNHPGTFLFEECVKVWFEKVTKESGEERRNKDNPHTAVLNATHVHFSPPCQAFSSINRTVGEENERNAENAYLTLYCIKIAKFFHQHRYVLECYLKNADRNNCIHLISNIYNNYQDDKFDHGTG